MHKKGGSKNCWFFMNSRYPYIPKFCCKLPNDLVDQVENEEVTQT